MYHIWCKCYYCNYFIINSNNNHSSESYEDTDIPYTCLRQKKLIENDIYMSNIFISNKCILFLNTSVFEYASLGGLHYKNYGYTLNVLLQDQLKKLFF